MRTSPLALLALALALAVVVGCGSNSAPTPTSAPAAAAAATAPAPTATTAPAPTATAAPTVAPTKAPTVAPTVAPTKTPAPAATPTTAASASGSGILDKMKGIRAFSADFTTDDGEDQAKGKMAFSGKKMRMDVEAMGITMSIIADEEKKTAYMYNPQEKKALSMPYDQSITGQTPGGMLDWEKTTTAPPKLLGEETLDGKACVIYEFTTADAKSKAWIDKATGFPIKTEATQDGQVVSARFTNVVIGNVDESLFTLPAGTEVLDMSGLMATPAATAAKSTTTRGSPTPASASRTPVRGSPTPASASSSATLSPTAITGAVPEVLKDNLSIPAGFKLVPGTGQSMEDLNTNTFEASAKWTGKASAAQLAKFYEGELAEGWESQGGVVGQDSLELSYTQNDTDPVIRLTVEAKVASGTATLTLTLTDAEP